jgi:hypothetical protein
MPQKPLQIARVLIAFADFNGLRLCVGAGFAALKFAIGDKIARLVA